MTTAQLKEDELNRWRDESPAAGNVVEKAEKGNVVAQKLRAAATQIKGATDETATDETGTQRVKKNISTYLNNAASYVEDADPKKIKTGIENEVRRNPGRSLLIVGAAGLVLGSLLSRRPPRA